MNATGKLTLSMIIFGTIGIFRRLIPLSSGLVAMSRGLIGVLFLLLVMRLRGDGMDRAAVRRKLPLLCLSGAAIGVNWILLFEAYNYTSVATATLCYYLAPMFVILASPLVLREKLTLRKLACVSAAQLGSSAAVLLPYVLLVEEVSIEAFTPGVIALLLVVGIVHTGIAYALYFGSLMQLKAQTAAILSYIDPVVAVLLSALVLREHMSLLSGLGAVLVLGAAVISELPNRGPAH